MQVTTNNGNPALLITGKCGADEYVLNTKERVGVRFSSTGPCNNSEATQLLKDIISTLHFTPLEAGSGREFTITQEINPTDRKWQFIQKDFLKLPDWQFSALKVDLNDDGIPETFVYEDGPGACGTHDCPLVVYSLKANNHIKIIDILGPASFLILPSKHNGFHNISFLGAGFRTNIWKFNGTIYEGQCTSGCM